MNSPEDSETVEALKQAALDQLAAQFAAASCLPLGDGNFVFVGTLDRVAQLVDAEREFAQSTPA